MDFNFNLLKPSATSVLLFNAIKARVFHRQSLGLMSISEMKKMYAADMEELEKNRVFLIHKASDGPSGHPVAFLVTKITTEGLAITMLGVVPERREQGFGYGILLQFLHAFAKDKPVPALWAPIAPDNIAALRIFTRLGFEAIGSVNDHFGPSRPAVALKWTDASKI